jgi:membrane protease YdiL (CAAX protease family)
MTETVPQSLPQTDFEIRLIPYPNIKSTIILFFIFLLNSLIVGIIVGGILGMSGFKLPVLKLMIYMAPLLITINSAIKRSKKQQGYASTINFNKFQLWLVPVLVIGTIALIIPIEWVSNLLPMPESVRKVFEATFTKGIFSIIIAVIAAPILEEILCRGIVLKGLLKNYPPYKAILVSAIFFAAMHLNPWQAIPAFFGGSFLGWIYYKTQSVIPGMIVHGTINGTATLFLFLPKYQQSLSGLLGMPYYLIALLGAILIFAVACIIINRKVIINPKSMFTKSSLNPPNL